MKRRAPWIYVVWYGGAATSIAACSLAIDPDKLVDELADAGGLADVVARDAGASESAPDALATPADAGKDASNDAPTCTPTGVEVCDDGVDNDCNGAVDCADPACTDGFACVDPPPVGWSAIVLAPDTRPDCPSGYGPSTDVRVLDGNGGTSCACDCGNNCGQTITLTKATGASCAPPSGSDTFQVAPTKCTTKSFDLASGFTSVATAGGSCAPVDTTTKNELTNGRTCAPPPKGGGGCPGAQRCLPKAAGFALCIARPGTNACPTSVFDKLHRAGSAATDQRTCAGCSCNSAACSVELDLWTHPTCQGALDLAITNACSANAALNNVKAYRSTVTNGCTPATPSLPQGTLAFDGEQTICCR